MCSTIGHMFMLWSHTTRFFQAIFWSVPSSLNSGLKILVLNNFSKFHLQSSISRNWYRRFTRLTRQQYQSRRVKVLAKQSITCTSTSFQESLTTCMQEEISSTRNFRNLMRRKLTKINNLLISTFLLRFLSKMVDSDSTDASLLKEA